MKKKPKYTNITQIQHDLKIYQLKRQIAVEQIKDTKNTIEEQSLHPFKILKSILPINYVTIFNALSLLRRLLK